MTLDSHTNCYVTGWFDGTNNFGGVTLTNDNVGGQDIFVAEYNSVGALQWAQQAGGNSGNLDAGRGVGVDTNGNIYVTGGFYGPADFGSTNLLGDPSGAEEFFLAKYNNAGAVQWVQQSVSGGSTVYGLGLAVDGAGNSYAVGYADNSATITFGSVNLINTNTTGTAFSSSSMTTPGRPNGRSCWAAPAVTTPPKSRWMPPGMFMCPGRSLRTLRSEPAIWSASAQQTICSSPSSTTPGL